MSIVEELRRSLEGLLDLAYSQTCEHEETHRGGVIWEICDQCGAKWADDEGGKPEQNTPPEITNAEKAVEMAKEFEAQLERAKSDVELAWVMRAGKDLQ